MTRLWKTDRQTCTSLTAGWSVAWTKADTVSTPAALDAAELAWRHAVVPGTLASGLEPAERRNLPRLDAIDAWYRVDFSAEPARDGETLTIRFGGLATLADVWLNGAPLVSSRNMFRSYVVDVTAQLAAENRLVIRCRALDPELAQRRPRPRWRAPMVEHQQLRWFRTTLLGRTPGWSLPFPAVGPYRPIELFRQQGLTFRELTLATRVENGIGVIELAGRATSLNADRATSAELVLVLGETTLRAPLELEATAEGQRISGSLRIADVALWWPHTHGEPCLYRATLRVKTSSAEHTVELGRVGFRTLELLTADGEFSLLLNGTPIFCRGACWTPVDPLGLSDSPAATLSTLERARDAGMNMLRVCGPMLYESEAFYERCDELGILVWQDFMFANMDYPEEPEFLAEAQAEARELLERLRAHVSLTVLCGDSEGEQQAAMWGAPRASWARPLFQARLREICAELSPELPYWPSSASGGAIPHQPNAGTTSYYGVGAYLRPLEDARRSELRFATECLGFANVPGEALMTELTGGTPARAHTPAWKAGVPRDLGAGWDFDDVRDHYLKELYGLDPSMLRTTDPERYWVLGRVTTGEVMDAAFREWRRSGSVCRGALVWFLRDLVAGAGWGVLDVGGQPKAAYYYLKRILQSRVLFFTDEGLNGLSLQLVNESAAPWEGRLELDLYRDFETRVGGASAAVVVPRRTSRAIAAAALLDSFADTTYAYRFGPPQHDLVVARLLNAEDGTESVAFHLPTGRAAPVERDLGLEAVLQALPDGNFALIVSTRALARSVAIEVSGFDPSDNFFHVAPGRSHRVILLRTGAGAEPRVGLLPLNGRATTRVAVRPKPEPIA